MNEVEKKATRIHGELRMGTLASNIGYLTRMVRNIVQETAPQFVERLGLLPGEITVLAVIAANEGISQNELARALMMKKSQITPLVQDLVTRGIVNRSELGTDRRFNALSLTADGKAVWKKANAAVDSHTDALLRSLTAAESGELMRLLRKVLFTNINGGQPMFTDVDL